MKSKKFSIRSQLVIAAILILVPMTGIFYVFVNKAIEQMNDQIAEANGNTLKGYCVSMEDGIRQIDAFFNILYGENEEFQKIALGETMDREEKERLETVLREETALNDAIAFIGVFQEEELFIHAVGTSWGEEELKLKSLSGEWIGKDSQRQGWFVEITQEGPYLIQILKKGKAKLLCAADMERLSENAQLSYGLESPAVFTDNQGNPLTSAVWIERTWGNKAKSFEDYCLAGEGVYRYMVVQESFLGMSVLYGVRYQDNNGVLKWLRLGPSLFLGAMAVLLVIVLAYLESGILRPLSSLVTTMERIRDGDLQCRTDRYISREFAQVNDTFNSMIGTITNLKIETYEQELAAQKAEMAAQKAEMTALRMQIHPHFYLNCLKNLYGLAEIKAFDEIQNMIILLSKHLRYIFHWNSEKVLLREELQMCENYVQLQAIGRRDQSRCLLDIAPELLEISVPSVSLLTLVENCVKHGTVLDHPLEVRIKGNLLPMGSGKLMDLIISDNGLGFPGEVLEKLNKGMASEEGGDHIGIWNLMQRFKLLYGERFGISFWNDSGAHIEIMLNIEQR